MKTIVLGLDGATFELILPAVARGELPGFARLIKEGAWGPLRSTVPADSPSAWMSFATGVNPGRHGVYGFMARRPGSYDYEIGSSLLVRAPTLWDRAGGRGLRVGVINVPFTYPPRPVNGFLVAGMMTPDRASSFTYPPELREALLRAVPGYSIGHGLGRAQGGDPRTILVRGFAATIAAREQATRLLAAKYEPDLLICVFTVLDRLQHFLWADRDERHPEHDPSSAQDYRQAIAAAYRQLDGVIVRTLEAMGKDSLVVVLSDHGFGPVSRTFYVNAWLAERGYLTLTGASGEPHPWKNRAARLARHILGFLRIGECWRERLRARRLISEAFVRAIDWGRTRAWFGLDRGVWLNVAGRDPLGTVKTGDEYEGLRSQLIAELEALEDPETGRRVVAAVHRREELFHGPNLAAAPDLLLEPAHDAGDPRGRDVLSERLGFRGPARFVGPSSPISGYHTPEGVLLLWGRGVPAGVRLAGAEMIDVAPTILRAINLPGSEEMDGKVLLELGGREKGAAEALSEASAESSAARKNRGISEDEQLQVEQQLKDLGYLD